MRVHDIVGTYTNEQGNIANLPRLSSKGVIMRDNVI